MIAKRVCLLCTPRVRSSYAALVEGVRSEYGVDWERGSSPFEFCVVYSVPIEVVILGDRLSDPAYWLQAVPWLGRCLAAAVRTLMRWAGRGGAAQGPIRCGHGMGSPNRSPILSRHSPPHSGLLGHILAAFQLNSTLCFSLVGPGRFWSVGTVSFVAANLQVSRTLNTQARGGGGNSPAKWRMTNKPRSASP